jgi:hypothetical protein
VAVLATLSASSHVERVTRRFVVEGAELEMNVTMHAGM